MKLSTSFFMLGIVASSLVSVPVFQQSVKAQDGLKCEWVIGNLHCRDASNQIVVKCRWKEESSTTEILVCRDERTWETWIQDRKVKY